jgi:hypothetical protein
MLVQEPHASHLPPGNRHPADPLEPFWFNNNRGADAPVAARQARELLGQDPGPDVGARPARAGLG